MSSVPPMSKERTLKRFAPVETLRLRSVVWLPDHPAGHQPAATEQDSGTQKRYATSGHAPTRRQRLLSESIVWHRSSLGQCCFLYAAAFSSPVLCPLLLLGSLVGGPLGSLVVLCHRGGSGYPDGGARLAWARRQL